MLAEGRRAAFVYLRIDAKILRLGHFVLAPALPTTVVLVLHMPTMDAPLCCNKTTCRAKLTERAVVTTCSHIFCPPCADETGLSRSIQAQRKCPACNASLSNPDDAVTTTLQPTEDYKTSVLSGLDPSTIMECAGRALAFWTYQSTQEMYSAHLNLRRCRLTASVCTRSTCARISPRSTIMSTVSWTGSSMMRILNSRIYKKRLPVRARVYHLQ